MLKMETRKRRSREIFISYAVCKSGMSEILTCFNDLSMDNIISYFSLNNNFWLMLL